jgi:catechol 2,3-dioxygenase-like lactoylglutathione lyase family enzyme
VQHLDDVRPFYVDYLGFTVEFEHRFAPDLPRYVRVARDAARLDLSEHHGDGTPGTVVWIPVADVTRLADDLVSRAWPTSRPAVDHDAPGGPTVEVIDPNGNVLRFCQAGPVARGRARG